MAINSMYCDFIIFVNRFLLPISLLYFSYNTALDGKILQIVDRFFSSSNLCSKLLQRSEARFPLYKYFTVGA